MAAGGAHGNEGGRGRQERGRLSGKITLDDINRVGRRVALERGHYTGYPNLLVGRSIQFCKGFPYPEIGEYIPAADEESEHVCRGIDETEQLRNRFHSRRGRGEVYIVWHGGSWVKPQHEGGKPYLKPDRVEVVVDRMPQANHRLGTMLDTMDCARGWSIEAEAKAMTRLAEHVNEHQFRMYFTAGSFIETSVRSGMSYIFRRLRPTVAMRGNRIRGALCLHPLAYYTDTYAGAMVPTDDVIAHLLLMRGDEHMFWRRANVHPIWRANAGV